MAERKTSRPGEFALIERYFSPLATDPGAFSLTDDAALVKQSPGDELVVTTDLVAAGVHFFPDDPPASIAKKALRVNLSDLAAKGAEPMGYLMSLALPADWTEEWIAAFTAGLKEDQERYRVTLLGGDTSRASGGLTIAITAIGRVPKGEMVQRSGAKPGDVVFVSGTIGDAALGLRIRKRSIDSEAAGPGADRLLVRYLHPEPKLALAAVLRRHASSALDVSDGLVGDLAHICDTSGVGAEINADSVPLSDAARAMVANDPTALASILTGGDDYEILATVPQSKAEAFVAEASAAGVPVTRIGRIVDGSGPPRVIDRAGKQVLLPSLSHTHF